MGISTDSVDWNTIKQMAGSMTQDQRDQAEQKIRSSGKLPLEHFKIAISVLFGIASLAFLGRIAIRLTSRRRLFLDDGFLITGFICLTASTVIFYIRARMMYLAFTLMGGDIFVSLIGAEEIDEVFSQMGWAFAYQVCLYTAIFAIKFCYLSFFHTLIRSMPKSLIRFYWISCVFTILCWLHMSLLCLIICPHFGQSAAKCFPTLPVSDAVLTWSFWSGPILDALTDIAIISIPIIVLRKSQMALVTKIGFGLFLCLSVFMVACSIIRAAGTYYGNNLDTPWQVFWQHAEACIGILMSSLTAYRSTLIGSNDASDRVQRFIQKIERRKSSHQISDPSEIITARGRFGRLLLATIPSGVRTSLGTLFGRNTSNDGRSTTLVTMDTAFDIAESDYHVHLRNLQSAGTGSGRTEVTSSLQGGIRKINTIVYIDH